MGRLSWMIWVGPNGVPGGIPGGIPDCGWGKGVGNCSDLSRNCPGDSAHQQEPPEGASPADTLAVVLYDSGQALAFQS